MIDSVAQLAETCTTNSVGATTCVATGAISGFLIVFILFYLAVIAVTIVAWVKILSKAGYSGWWVLIGFVPLVGAVFFLIFAFSDWPVLQRLRAGQRGQTMAYAGGYGAPHQPWAQPGYATAPVPAPTGAPAPWAPPPPAGTTATAPVQPPDAPLPKFFGPSASQATPAPSEPDAQPSAAPPGWYPADGGERYWDGTSWTDQTR